MKMQISWLFQTEYQQARRPEKKKNLGSLFLLLTMCMWRSITDLLLLIKCTWQTLTSLLQFIMSTWQTYRIVAVDYVYLAVHYTFVALITLNSYAVGPAES